MTWIGNTEIQVLARIKGRSSFAEFKRICNRNAVVALVEDTKINKAYWKHHNKLPIRTAKLPVMEDEDMEDIGNRTLSDEVVTVITKCGARICNLSNCLRYRLFVLDDSKESSSQ